MAEAATLQEPEIHSESDVERAKRLVVKLNNMRTANGASEQEALTAVARIGELVEKFNLDLTELFVEKAVCKELIVFAPDDAMYGVAMGIGILCDLVVYSMQKNDQDAYVLFGLERDVELAEYLYCLCADAADDEWQRHIDEGHGHTKKQRESFRIGFGSRMKMRMDEIAAKMKADRESRVRMSGSTDMVLVKDAKVQEEFSKKGITLVTTRAPTVSNRESYNRGAMSANRVNINNPLSGPADKGLIR